MRLLRSHRDHGLGHSRTSGFAVLLERPSLGSAALFSRSCTLGFAALLSCACAGHAPQPLTVRYADIGHVPLKAAAGQPLILRFEKGDRIPVVLEFESQAFALSPAPPAIELVATRRSFLLVDGNGLHGSLDGRDFQEKPLAPGRFSAGFGLTPEHATVRIHIVAPRKPMPPDPG